MPQCRKHRALVIAAALLAMGGQLAGDAVAGQSGAKRTHAGIVRPQPPAGGFRNTNPGRASALLLPAVQAAREVATRTPPAQPPTPPANPGGDCMSCD